MEGQSCKIRDAPLRESSRSGARAGGRLELENALGGGALARLAFPAARKRCGMSDHTSQESDKIRRLTAS